MTVFRMELKFLFIVLFSLPFALGFRSVEQKEIDVIPNPYDTACQARSLNELLEPYHLIIKPLKTQQDTFRNIIFRKVFSVPIPIYRMKQPERLSKSQLDYQLVLVKDLALGAKASVYETPVERERAEDSWFPGYFWTPIVTSCGNDQWQHVGWKFTSLQENSALPFFYALMVNVNDDEVTKEGIFVGGMKAASWMVARVIS
jgi:hypothetical protein